MDVQTEAFLKHLEACDTIKVFTTYLLLLQKKKPRLE